MKDPEATPRTREFIFPLEIKDLTNEDMAEFIDVHQQLRHEASGLRLALAGKQEILERVVALHEQLAAELHSSRTTIASQENTIQTLTRQLAETRLQVESLHKELIAFKNSTPRTSPRKLVKQLENKEASNNITSSSTQTVDIAADAHQRPSSSASNISENEEKPQTSLRLSSSEEPIIDSETIKATTLPPTIVPSTSGDEAAADQASDHEKSEQQQSSSSTSDPSTTREIMQRWQQQEAAALLQKQHDAMPLPRKFNRPVFVPSLTGVPLKQHGSITQELSPGCKITSAAVKKQDANKETKAKPTV